MTERNTPVGDISQGHGLIGLLEARCYLRTADKRIDVTKASFQGDPIGVLLISKVGDFRIQCVAHEDLQHGNPHRSSRR